jgi:hypothetical protein
MKGSPGAGIIAVDECTRPISISLNFTSCGAGHAESAIRSRHDGERHLAVGVGNVETPGGDRQVFGAMAKSDTGIAVPIHRKLETSGRSGGTDLTSRRLRCLQPNHRRTGFVPRGAGPGLRDIGRPNRRSSRHRCRAAPLTWALARVRPTGNARVNSRHPAWFYRRPRAALGAAAAIAGHMLTPVGPKSFTAA